MTIPSLIHAAGALALTLVATEAKAVSKCTPEFFNQKRVSAQVVTTRDGDTVEVYVDRGSHGAGRFAVRLLSVDTPESYYRGYSQGKWANQAKYYLAKALQAGDQVVLELDRERCDYYGRVLAYVHKDGKDINRALVEKGLAANYCMAPNLAHCHEYADLVSNARFYKRGFWKDSTVKVPYMWRASLRGSSPASCVGDLKTQEVYGIDQLKKVRVENRIFFSSCHDVRAPYRFVM